MKNIYDTQILHNGISIPQFGLGLYKVDEGIQTVETVLKAIETGYRLLDTASLYDNEVGVGQAVRECGLSREELFITTKVWNDDQGYEETLQAFETSMKKLGMDYLDLYLIHWPVKGKYIDTWRAMEKLYQDGRIKAIGVSNFHIPQLEDLLKNSTIKPVINQVEMHPRLTQEDLREYCQHHDIAMEAWSPLGRGRILDEPTINYIAEKYQKTAAQVILRWHLQKDTIVIPKSVHPERIVENAQIFDFEISIEDMGKIDSLNMNERFGQNPDRFAN